MRVAVLIYPDTEPIDLATLGVLSMARRVAPQITAYTVAANAGITRMANGLQVVADYSYEDAPTADVLIITGGPGWQREAQTERTLAYIRRAHHASAVAAVCTGGMILAASGLLDGHSATTKCQVTAGEVSPLQLLGERHPLVQAVEARIVDCGRLFTGGGVTLCIDMTLYLIERFVGGDEARETARILEYGAAYAANEARLTTVQSS